MKYILPVLIFVLATTLPAGAITGLGLGVHVGTTTSYDYSSLDDYISAISDSLESLGFPAIQSPKFNDKLTVIGIHGKIGTLPIIDFIGFLDYGWKKKSLGSGVDFRVSDFSFGLTALKKFGSSILKPYAGLGLAWHKLAYTLEAGQSLVLPPAPADETKTGYHFVLGAELGFPLFPLAPYAEGRYNIISTTDNSTKFLLLSAGLTMNF
jgi:hypothetical protein